MEEPARKKLKSSNGRISAFHAFKTARKYIEVPDKSVSGGCPDGSTKSSADVPVASYADSKSGNDVSHAPIHSSSLEAQDRENVPKGSLPRQEMMAVIQPSSEQNCIRPASCSVQQLCHMRGLLFPASSNVSSDRSTTVNQDFETDTINQNRDAWYNSAPSSSRRSRLQEQGIAEIYDNDLKSDSHHSATLESPTPRKKTKYPPFVHGTANLVSTVLTDVEPDDLLLWEELFSHLGRPPLIDPAQKAQTADKANGNQGYKRDSYRKMATVQPSKNDSAVLPSQAYAKKAVYAMAWIRFVNTFVDRDVRVLKAEVKSNDQPSIKPTEPQQYHNPEKAPESCINPDSTSQDADRSLYPPEPEDCDIDINPPSFISLNPYGLLSSQNEEDSRSTSSAEDANASSFKGISKKHGTMHAQALAIGMPTEFVDMRHRCVHNADMQSVKGPGGLREMVKLGLEWVWDRYWKDIKLEEDEG